MLEENSVDRRIVVELLDLRQEFGLGGFRSGGPLPAFHSGFLGPRTLHIDVSEACRVLRRHDGLKPGHNPAFEQSSHADFEIDTNLATQGLAVENLRAHRVSLLWFGRAGGAPAPHGEGRAPAGPGLGP